MTPRIARGAVVLGTATLAAAALSGCATGNGNWSEQGLSAEIRRTSYGIPHIRANDYASVAFGMAYAYAQDNVCLMASQVVTVSGERSATFGPDGTTEVSFADAQCGRRCVLPRHSRRRCLAGQRGKAIARSA
jgi:acyl-homoserine-lactone acylase